MHSIGHTHPSLNNTLYRPAVREDSLSKLLKIFERCSSPCLADIRPSFDDLPQSLLNRIYTAVCDLAGRSLTEDLQWGEDHAFDDLSRLKEAIETCTRNQFGTQKNHEENPYGWSQSDAGWNKVEGYAKAGYRPIFFLNPDDSIRFVGDTTGSESIHNYIRFPHIKEALHAFVLSSIEGVDPSLATVIEGLNLYAECGDAEGISQLLNQLQTSHLIQKIKPDDLKEIIVQAIANFHLNVLNELQRFMPFQRFQGEEQQHFFSCALSLGNDEALGFLLANGCHASDEDDEKAQRLFAWFNGDAEKVFPSLMDYQSSNKFLNNQHLNLYGGDDVQQIYRQETRKNVLFTLWTIHELKKSERISGSFTPLLSSLGNRRRHIAYQSGTSNAYLFGMPRSSCSLVTIVDNGYEGYAARAKNFSDGASLTINGEKYDLFCTDNDALVPHLNNTFLDFWVDKHPVALYVADVYEGIVREDWSNRPEELKDAIANLHRLLSNLSIFMRGSAATSETLTDALWLMQGYVSQPMEQGKSLDIEAMLAKNLESYQAIYPAGLQVIGKGWGV